MARFCDAHAFGCGCKTECTKAIDLGRFKTARTMSEEQRLDLMRRYRNMANACVALGLVSALMPVRFSTHTPLM